MAAGCGDETTNFILLGSIPRQGAMSENKYYKIVFKETSLVSFNVEVEDGQDVHDAIKDIEEKRNDVTEIQLSEFAGMAVVNPPDDNDGWLWYGNEEEE